MIDFQKYILEHQDLYKKLEYFLGEFTSLKNKRDDDFLLKTSLELYDYIENLLLGHFADEEKNLFHKLRGMISDEVLNQIINDHREIEKKFLDLKKACADYKALQEAHEEDYKIKLLYPSYNLIATINHHAQREDRHIFCLTS